MGGKEISLSPAPESARSFCPPRSHAACTAHESCSAACAQSSSRALRRAGLLAYAASPARWTLLAASAAGLQRMFAAAAPHPGERTPLPVAGGRAAQVPSPALLPAPSGPLQRACTAGLTAHCLILVSARISLPAARLCSTRSDAAALCSAQRRVVRRSSTLSGTGGRQLVLLLQWVPQCSLSTACFLLFCGYSTPTVWRQA